MDFDIKRSVHSVKRFLRGWTPFVGHEAHDGNGTQKRCRRLIVEGEFSTKYAQKEFRYAFAGRPKKSELETSGVSSGVSGLTPARLELDFVIRLQKWREIDKLTALIGQTSASRVGGRAVEIGFGCACEVFRIWAPSGAAQAGYGYSQRLESPVDR